MRCSELAVELEQKGAAIDQRANKIQAQIEKLQTRISQTNSKLMAFLEYLGLFR